VLRSGTDELLHFPISPRIAHVAPLIPLDGVDLDNVLPLVRSGPSAPSEFSPVRKVGSSRGRPLEAQGPNETGETVTSGRLAISPYVHGSLLDISP